VNIAKQRSGLETQAWQTQMARLVIAAVRWHGGPAVNIAKLPELLSRPR
jgi:hypothetical protein